MTRQRHLSADLADADINDAFANADRMIYPNIRIKCYINDRRGAFRIEPAECFEIDLPNLRYWLSQTVLCSVKLFLTLGLTK